MLIEIKHDVYNISKRIKEIDRYYKLVYNTKSCKFEVHSSNQIGGSYCLSLPYPQLDERTLTYTLSTRSENILQILAQIDNENKLLESAFKRKALSQVCETIEQTGGNA